MLASLGHPCKFQRVSRLGSVTAQHSSSGRQPNFAALNTGRHLYSEGRPSRWALADILVSYIGLWVGWVGSKFFFRDGLGWVSQLVSLLDYRSKNGSTEKMYSCSLHVEKI